MPLSAEDCQAIADIRKRTQAGQSPEDTQKHAEAREKLKTDPEAMAAFKAEQDATFKAADTDGDGKLSYAEYVDYMDKTYANAEAKGFAAPRMSEDDTKLCFEVLCRYNADSGADGFTFEDL